MQCLFCDNEIENSSIEHIVPESLGNIWYTLPSGYVCNKCNGEFSKFEDKAISNTQLGFVRIINGIRTKKGNAGSFKIGNIKGIGTENLDKNVLTFYGLEEKDIVGRNPENNTYQIKVPDFHKSEMATSKLLLKIAYESLAKSKKSILSKYNFEELKRYLIKIDNKDWPFITTRKQLFKFISIPKYNDKNNLNRIKCKLLLSEVSDEILLFEFRYDYVGLVINILNRDFNWSKKYLEADQLTGIYPNYMSKY